MVKLRLTKIGRHHLNLYRLVAADSRSPRDGKVLENLGNYDPNAEKDEDKIKINEERVRYWLSVGAQPNDKVWTLLRKRGINKSNIKAAASA